MSAESSPISVSHAPIGKQEALELTLQLRNACFGDRYDNPELYGTLANFQTKHWRARDYHENPAQYDEAIEQQLSKFREVVEPHLGKTVVAKTVSLAMDTGEDRWEAWTAPAPFFATGQIVGAEGRPVITRRFFKCPIGRGIEQIAPDSPGIGYRAGVALKLDGPIRTNQRIEDAELPHAETVIVTPRNFPASYEYFNQLFSNQLQPPAG